MGKSERVGEKRNCPFDAKKVCPVTQYFPKNMFFGICKFFRKFLGDRINTVFQRVLRIRSFSEKFENSGALSPKNHFSEIFRDFFEI